MLFSEADGRKVVSTSTADTVGKIDQFVVDPASHSVVALVLKKADTGDILMWPAIAAFGVDAVTVTSAEAITGPDEKIAVLSDKHHRVLGKRVLTAKGDDIGEVADVEFDAGNGVINTLVVGDRQVPGWLLRGVGSYAVVVDVQQG